MYGENPTSVLRDITKRNSCATDTILFERIEKLVNFDIKQSQPNAPHWDGELNGLLRDIYLIGIAKNESGIIPILPEITKTYEFSDDEIESVIDTIHYLVTCGPDEYIDGLIDTVMNKL